MSKEENAVGILHPGAMGISVAASMKNSGYDVYWVSEGRSAQSRARAEEHALNDAGTLQALCDRCALLVSVCPPHAAEELADTVIATGYQGLYIDANAIAPQRALRIDEALQAAGVRFVDGSIIGGPAWEPNSTWLYLSGEEADTAARYFAAGPLETEVISPEIGKASAIKMVWAAYSKGTTALLAAINAVAEHYEVRADLATMWQRRDPDHTAQSENRTRRVTAKAWRFAGEMDEIAATFSEAGLPGGFHQAAAEVYRRIAKFKDAPETPALLDVLSALLERDGSAS